MALFCSSLVVFHQVFCIRQLGSRKRLLEQKVSVDTRDFALKKNALPQAYMGKIFFMALQDRTTFRNGIRIVF